MSNNISTNGHTEKSKGGRPTKYKPQYCRALIDFIKVGGPLIKKPIVVSDGSGTGSHIVDHVIGQLPAFFEGFAAHIKVDVTTLHEWKARHPKFAQAYKKSQAIQLDYVLKGLLSGSHQVAGAIFFLKNNPGYKDRHEVEQSGELVTRLIVEGSDEVTIPTRMTVSSNGH